MEKQELRPRFRYYSHLTQEELYARIIHGLKNANPDHLQYRTVSNHLLISFPREQRHFWSPMLDINLEQAGKQTVLRGLMGPEPSIWTMFVFFYTVGGLAVLAGLILGYSQYLLGHGVYYFLLIPAGLALVAFFYLAALFGKKQAAAQMAQLMLFLEGCIGTNIHKEPDH